jgi:hypothetical protein
MVITSKHAVIDRKTASEIIEMKQLISECQTLDSIAKRIGNNSLLKEAIAKRGERIHFLINGDKYHCNIGGN